MKACSWMLTGYRSIVPMPGSTLPSEWALIAASARGSLRCSCASSGRQCLSAISTSRSWGRRLMPFLISCEARLACAHESKRSEEHTSELQSLMRISSDVFCLKKNSSQQITDRNKTKLHELHIKY